MKNASITLFITLLHHCHWHCRHSRAPSRVQLLSIFLNWKRSTWKRRWFLSFTSFHATDRQRHTFTQARSRSNNGCEFYHIIHELFQFQHINLWRQQSWAYVALYWMNACFMCLGFVANMCTFYVHHLQHKLKTEMTLHTPTTHTDTRNAFTNRLFLLNERHLFVGFFFPFYFISFIFDELQ